MLSFKKKAFAAVLRDMGYSGSRRADQFIAYFTDADTALFIAQDAAGNVQSTGQKGVYEPIEFDIQIYESRGEYEVSQTSDLVRSAKEKLSAEEFESLTKHILKKKKGSKCKG